MLVQHFPINPDTHGNVGKLFNNILNYGCSPIQGNISNFYPSHAYVFFLLSKTVCKNLSTLVNTAPLNICKKRKVFCICKKGNQDVKVSEKEIYRFNYIVLNLTN